MEERDEELWRRVNGGDAGAFAALVGRYQSLVCAVAYSACGDLAQSEDIAQETFWAAWRQRTALEAPERLRGWLCGIARNLAHNASRRGPAPALPLEGVPERRATDPGPADEAITREEEELIWRAIGHLPESYREAIVLYYREGRAVAEVAAALGVSEDAAKQRLARGRAMVRDRLTERVERGLGQSRPGTAFTAAVVAGLSTAAPGVAKAGIAAAAGPAAKAVAASAASGVAVGLLGSLVGLAGGWFGSWLPAQLAATKGERELILHTGRRTLGASVVMVVVLCALIWGLGGRRPGVYVAAWLAILLTFQAYVGIEVLRLNRALRRARAEAGPGAEPNDTVIRANAARIAKQVRGRRFRSRATLLGWPLVDIDVSDPGVPGAWGSGVSERRVARGWIAIGDAAHGVLLGVGGRARGAVAMGGVSIGLVSLGGVAVGGIALGGLGLGVVGIGGLAIGVLLAVGGLAIGGAAAGGGAIAWDVAVGGLAIARRAAFGGFALARDFAVGGGGGARHFNDEAARAVTAAEPLRRGMDWYVAHNSLATVVVVAVAVLLPMAMTGVMYRRGREGEDRVGREATHEAS